jgi:cell wall-associated NlpC family hydrolase
MRFGRRAVVALTLGAGMALTPLPALADAGGTTVGATTAAPAAAPTAAAQVAVDTALAQLGDPYVWGGAGPNAFDCSGLTQYAYGAAGVYLPHSSRMQAGIGTPVAYSDLQPGDLVFFYSPVSHVGMYIGNGQIVHAPTSGSVVQVVPLAYMPNFAGARRLA